MKSEEPEREGEELGARPLSISSVSGPHPPPADASPLQKPESNKAKQLSNTCVFPVPTKQGAGSKLVAAPKGDQWSGAWEGGTAGVVEDPVGRRPGGAGARDPESS